MIRSTAFAFALATALLGSPASAQENEVPYWAAIRSTVVNMRVGPAETYPIEWVYKRPGLPVRVLRKKEGWRLVEDPDGARGWMLGRFLTLDRGAIVIGDGLAAMRSGPSAGSALKWNVEPGVTGALGDCEKGWCEFSVGPQRGYIEEARVWGDGAP